MIILGVTEDRLTALLSPLHLLQSKPFKYKFLVRVPPAAAAEAHAVMQLGLAGGAAGSTNYKGGNPMTMNNLLGSEIVRFYFSFRSPYSWLALHRLSTALDRLPVTVETIPIYPPDDFPNDPAAAPAKVAYIRSDIARTARAYGLELHWPQGVDTKWVRPHTAYLYAEEMGRGTGFAKEVFAARFSRGLDVAADETLEAAAAASGLDPASVLKAADDPGLQDRVKAGIRKAFEEGVFGVPTFIYRGEKFWGNDRLDWLAREIKRNLGHSVPDLSQDLMARPQG